MLEMNDHSTYFNTSQLDLWGGGNLGGSERDQFSSLGLEGGEEFWLGNLSDFESLDLLGW